MLLAPPFAMAERADHCLHGAPHLQRALFEGRPLRDDDPHQACGGSGNRDDLTAFDLTASPPAPFVLKANIDTGDPLKLPGDPMITATGNGMRR